jgi:hypothetical protein
MTFIDSGSSPYVIFFKEGTPEHERLRGTPTGEGALLFIGDLAICASIIRDLGEWPEDIPFPEDLHLQRSATDQIDPGDA